MEHGLEYITFYVKKHITPQAISSTSPIGREKPLGTPACETPLLEWGRTGVAGARWIRGGEVGVGGGDVGALDEKWARGGGQMGGGGGGGNWILGGGSPPQKIGKKMGGGRDEKKGAWEGVEPRGKGSGPPVLPHIRSFGGIIKILWQ